LSGSCKVNISCDCDVKPEVRPEKQAAFFAKEFQDKLYKTIFTKPTDDDETTAAPATTIPSTGANRTNCSNDVQVWTETYNWEGGG